MVMQLLCNTLEQFGCNLSSRHSETIAFSSDLDLKVNGRGRVGNV